MTTISTIDRAVQPAVLALNNMHAEELSWLEPAQLSHLVTQAFYARRIGKLEAFLLAFDQDADYDSPNFLWFKKRYPRFVYVDRIAVAESARGRGHARLLYRDLETELAAESTPLDAHTRMLHAQCLARLGRKAEALRMADEVLKQRPEDLQILNQAAQLYVLAGERLPALYYTDLALKNGLRREWFTIPEFRSLEKDPEFRALLDRNRARKSEG